MNIKKSLYFRAKHYVLNYQKFQIKKAYGIDNKENFPIEIMETLETIISYVKKAKVLLDVGAHKGLFAKTAAHFLKLEKVICFEPNIKLNDTIKQNNKPSCIIENIALSDNNEKTTFYLHQDDAMNSIVKSNNKILKDEFPWDNPNEMRETNVTTSTLDNYIQKKGLKNNTFILKLDTQGNELNILKHGLKTLALTEICIIEFMFLTPYRSNYEFVDLVSFMNDNKFECKGALNIARRPSKKVSAVDFIFVKKED